jgi:hypothetical protein
MPAVPAAEPAEAAAEREPGDAGRGVDPERRREPERLRLPVEVAEPDAGLDARGARAASATRARS